MGYFVLVGKHVKGSALCLLLLVCRASCFLSSDPKFARRQRRPHRFSASRLSDAERKESSVIYLVNWDGCFADTVNWRIQLGIKLASAVWPELDVAIDRDDMGWLENKLSALSHVLTQSSDNISATCEYALAARLLVEEQELDGGHSNGKGGEIR